jgi:hypothetical protein
VEIETIHAVVLRVEPSIMHYQSKRGNRTICQAVFKRIEPSARLLRGSELPNRQYTLVQHITKGNSLVQQCSGGEFRPAVLRWRVSPSSTQEESFVQQYSGGEFLPAVLRWRVSSASTQVESFVQQYSSGEFRAAVLRWRVSCSSTQVESFV